MADKQWIRQEACPECDGDGCLACMADKPATGSGEPSKYPDMGYNAGGKYPPFRPVPIPPASQPTVTLSWEMKRLAAAAENLLTGGKFQGCDLTDVAHGALAELRRALALLRAAEQK